MTYEKEKEISTMIQEYMGKLITHTAKKVKLSFNKDSEKKCLEEYNYIKNLIKPTISDDDFKINGYKVASILSLAIQNTSPLMISTKGDTTNLKKHYNSILAYIVSEKIIKSFTKKENQDRSLQKLNINEPIILNIRKSISSMSDSIVEKKQSKSMENINYMIRNYVLSLANTYDILTMYSMNCISSSNPTKTHT